MTFQAPSSIVIIGSGVFGVSTAFALSKRPLYASSSITLVDRSPFPNPYGSSIDIARIVRADYSDPAYAKLANKAMTEWRKQGDNEMGGQGRYTESGLIIVGNEGDPNMKYVRNSYANMQAISKAANDPDGLEELPSKAAIAKKIPTGGSSGDWGYINKRSGWSDAEKATTFVRRQVEKSGRVKCVQGDVVSLEKKGKKIIGVKLADGTILAADLVIVATGAWTSELVDLRGRATATGQVLAYMRISEEERKRIASLPVLLNLSDGMFIVPPTADGVFRIARHAFGYINPTTIPSTNIRASLPTKKTAPASNPSELPNDPIPAEAHDDFRTALREMAPAFADREFERTRLCWYTDTAEGDFLITYHPEYEGLFMATGGSGHGFKFLPVIGDAIADTVEGRCPEDFKDKWAWPKASEVDVATNDGSRAGKPGLVLGDELSKTILKSKL